MKYAIFDGALSPNQTTRVADVIEAPQERDGQTFQLSELYHPALVATMRKCPDETVPGSTYDVQSDTWQHPQVMVIGDTGNGNPPPPPSSGG